MYRLKFKFILKLELTCCLNLNLKFKQIYLLKIEQSQLFRIYIHTYISNKILQMGHFDRNIQTKGFKGHFLYYESVCL